MRIVLNSPVGKFTALRNNKSCLSRRLVLSQPSQLVSSTFHVSSMCLPCVFSVPVTFAWTQIEKHLSWIALNADIHACKKQNMHFAIVCDCVIKVKPGCISMTIEIMRKKTWHTEWICMCLFYCFHIFSSVLQSSAKCLFVLQSHMNLRSSFRSFRSERFLGHIWRKSSLGLSKTQDRHNRSRGIPGNPGESVPGDSKAKHPKHPIQCVNACI